MRKAALPTLIVITALVFAQNLALAQNNNNAKSDPWAGTWKLDTAKSKLHEPAPKEETVEVSPGDGNTLKYSVKGTARDEKPFAESYDGKADGNPYPMTLNGQEAGRISYHKDSDHKYSTQATMADGSSSVGTVVLSEDGKTITVTSHIKDQNGEYEQIAIYRKQ